VISQYEAKIILVTGSRDWDDYQTIWSELNKCISAELLLHGMARGADRLADRAAKELKFKAIRGYPALWDEYGRSAGPIRNSLMLTHGKPDFVLAFQKDGSRGTQHMIDIARKAGVSVKVITMEGVKDVSRNLRFDFDGSK
jgi:hypothetical protein